MNTSKLDAITRQDAQIYTPVSQPNPTQPTKQPRSDHSSSSKSPSLHAQESTSGLCQPNLHEKEGGFFSLIDKWDPEDSRFRVSLLHHLFITFSRIGTSNTIITGNIGAAGVNVMAKIPAVTTIWRSVYMWIPRYPFIPCSGGSSLDGLCQKCQ